MTTGKLALLDDYQDVALDHTDWRKLGGWEVHPFHTRLAGDDLVAALQGFTAAATVGGRTAFPADVLAQLPDLKLIIGAGSDTPGARVVDPDAAARAGVSVVELPQDPRTTAELVWALALAAIRRMPQQQKALRAGDWKPELGRRLAGKTLGLLGVDPVNTILAGYARAFGMDVVAWDPDLTDEAAAGLGAARAELVVDLCAAAHIVSVRLPLNERTRNLLTPAELTAIGGDGVLVNTSASGVADPFAILAALHEDSLGAAALDAHEEEPLPASSHIHDTPNTLLTPRLGFATEEDYDELYSAVRAAVAEWAAGQAQASAA
ncbi:NAD(P)-dependent oxidoreductase [Zhihengliuella salsuginis]|uniref:2-hydroxyacid dehydrogenase n=1 Tax=Zhihengliuella salsuginis TaxID=578222 RepID=A0ABQ3GIV5_9MICC|nr:NAD(P)-dependent oxidoreductase [Zhihengliuella salsuginis]GHD05270.1 2-hydroxyacid dehydrogenase [Zhihengliuella salsuginis]